MLMALLDLLSMGVVGMLVGGLVTESSCPSVGVGRKEKLDSLSFSFGPLLDLVEVYLAIQLRLRDWTSEAAIDGQRGRVVVV
jgi:hypothetical protein